MSHWNRTYLDALEVPVWVPLNDLSEETELEETQLKETLLKGTLLKENHTKSNSVQPQEQSNAIAETTTPLEQTDSFQIIEGDPSAAFVFVLPDNADVVAAKETLKKLQFAWQAWLDQPLSTALLQPAEPATGQKSGAMVELDSFSGRMIDCRRDSKPLEQPSIPAPELDFQQENKKEWWQLLQRLQ